MNEITKGILIGVLTTAVISFAAYVIVIRENQVEIRHITEELKELVINQKGVAREIGVTKLIVAQAHPDAKFPIEALFPAVGKLEPKKQEEISKKLQENPYHEWDAIVRSYLPSVDSQSLVDHDLAFQTHRWHRWHVDEPALEDKLDRFLVNHPEQTPMSGLKGFLPYATVVGYEAHR